MAAQLLRKLTYITFYYFHCFVTEGYSQNESDACPVWMVYNESAVPHCQPIVRASQCNNNNAQMPTDFCIGFDNLTQRIVIGSCPYSYYHEDYLRQLNSSVTVSQLNEALCEPLNRKGLFCRECKPGYGIPVYSKAADECEKCESQLTWLVVYLALELIPLTLFYILVIIFNFSATRPPITAYIFYCQLFTQVAYNVRFIKHLFKIKTNSVFLYLTWTISDVWNLDMLRYVIPSFCLSEELNNFDALFLELITALYPILLIILTIILIEMHASNFRLVVCIWKPFNRCFASFRRTWDPRSSVINAFTTFLLLSSFKVSYITFSLVDKTVLYTKNRTEIDEVLPTIRYQDVYKQPYFVPLLVLNTLFVTLPIILLGVYPTKVCQKLIRCSCTGRQRSVVLLFMESFQGYYKNGTAGTHDYRSASCIGFLLRFIVCYELSCRWSRNALSNNVSVTFNATLLIVTSLFYALVRPYKKVYMNVIESLLYSTAAVLLIYIIHNNNFPPLFTIILAIIFMPNVIFMGIIVYKISHVVGVSKKINNSIVCKKLFFRRANNSSDQTENEPHRLSNPTEYPPLIPKQKNGHKGKAHYFTIKVNSCN